MKAVPFLKESAEYVAHKYENSVSCCIILPSNRSASAFKSYYIGEKKRNSFMPEIKSIESFMETLSNMAKADSTMIMLELFKIHNQLHPDNPQSLHRFSGFADMLQRDFNDIDISMANSDSVFSNIQGISEIKAKFDREDRFFIHQKQIEFCKDMPHYYTQLKNKLEKQGIAYQGMQYRYVAEHLDEILKHLPYQKFIFIGFSALSIAEEHIVNHLMQKGMAEMIVDDDAWYMKSGSSFLAGKFINDLSTRISLTRFKHDFLHQTDKEVNIWGCPQETSQADCLPEILNQIRKSFGADNPDAKGVIVLLQENMLLPVLFSLPDDYVSNISMEYSMQYTPLFELLHTYWFALENRDTFSASDKRKKLYHKDIRAFLGNALIQQRFALDKCSLDFSHENRLFYTREQWEDLLESLPQQSVTLLAECFFNSDPEKMFDLTVKLLDYAICDDMPEIFRNMNQFLKEEMKRFYPIVQQSGKRSIRDLRFLWEKMLASTSIPFESDHFSSLQINGMLETRALDFDYVIILSANEGILPHAKTAQTMIPFDVRRAYSLPTFQNHEAIMTYHFYRLLQRAEKVYLLYNTDGRNEIKEKSRLLHQLELYWKELPNVLIRQRIFPLPLPEHIDNQVMHIKKEDEIEQFLLNFSFSPSSINTFLTCPLQFCLHYFFRLDPAEEPEEMIQASTMGSVIHKILEERINPHTLNLDTKNLKEEIIDSFQNYDLTGLHLSENDICHEKNLLVLELCHTYLEDYLKLFGKKMENIKSNPVQVAEQKFNKEDLFEWNGKPVYCNGCIDRADFEHQVLCIIDYKTGFVDEKKLKLAQMDELYDGSHKEALQLMLYMYYKYRAEKRERLQAKIISLQRPDADLYLEINSKSVFDSIDFEDFSTSFQTCFLSKILDTQQDFEPVPGEHCSFCKFDGICNLQVSDKSNESNA